MTKIEPMTVEEMRAMVPRLFASTKDISLVERRVASDVLRLILAWAQERAKNNRHLWFTYLNSIGVYAEQRHRLKWTDADWLNKVLSEIGWPEDMIGESATRDTRDMTPTKEN